MGMYTQIRGWINVSPRLKYKEVGFDKKPYLNDFKSLKEEFIKSWKGARAELATSTSTYNIGSDWEHFIFFGGSIKDYDSDLDGWLKFIVSKYKNVDGVVEFQYEEDEFASVYTIELDSINIETRSCVEKQYKGDYED